LKYGTTFNNKNHFHFFISHANFRQQITGGAI